MISHRASAGSIQPRESASTGPHSVSVPRSQSKGPPGAGNSCERVGQHPLIRSCRFRHGCGLGQDVGQGRLLVHQPNHFAGDLRRQPGMKKGSSPPGFPPPGGRPMLTGDTYPTRGKRSDSGPVRQPQIDGCGGWSPGTVLTRRYGRRFASGNCRSFGEALRQGKRRSMAHSPKAKKSRNMEQVSAMHTAAMTSVASGNCRSLRGSAQQGGRRWSDVLGKHEGAEYGEPRSERNVHGAMTSVRLRQPQELERIAKNAGRDASLHRKRRRSRNMANPLVGDTACAVHERCWNHLRWNGAPASGAIGEERQLVDWCSASCKA